MYASTIFNRDANFSILITIFVSYLFAICRSSSLDSPTTTYHALYDAGKVAYFKEKWFECYSLVSRALVDYKAFHTTTDNCRSQCKKLKSIDFDETNFLEPIYMETSKKVSVCIRECLNKQFPGRKVIEESSVKLEEIEKSFVNLDPYDYVQLCAFKAELFEQAYSAAYTFSLGHPNHPYAQDNVDYYRKLPGAKPEWFVNLEAKPHQELREKGMGLYSAGNFTGAIEYLEASLLEYYKANERCSDACERLDTKYFDSLYNKTTSMSVHKEQARKHTAEHWHRVLKCRQLCGQRLATVQGATIDHFYLDHFDYLQYSYYKSNNIPRAVECVATILLFNPNHADQLYNKIFYIQENMAKEEQFKPRKDALEFYETKNLEFKLSKLIDEELGKSRTTSKSTSFTFASPELYGPRSDSFLDSFSTFTKSLGVTVAMEANDLGGRERRVVADGLANEGECKRLVQLASIGQRDKLDTVSVTEAAEFVREGKASSEQVETYMNVSERVRQTVEKYHNMKSTLLFHRSVLTCRTSDEDKVSPDDRSLDELNGCSTETAALCSTNKKRDFISMLYLDSNQDGLFYFKNPNDNAKPKLHVPAKHGRLISFVANDNHSYEKLKSGRRCVLLLWFTLSPFYQELEHAQARSILRALKGGSKTTKLSLPTIDYLKSKHYTIALDGDDLNGDERYAVDGLASEEECEALIRLTNTIGSSGSGYQEGFAHTKHEKFFGVTVYDITKVGGTVGDGYTFNMGNKKSPHTRYEAFEGLNVDDAVKLAAEHKVSVNDVALYLRLSNEMKEVTRRLFVGGDDPLYFAFTHLVCRAALNDANIDRTDLSHPIHSDNCIIQSDNSCSKVRPAYTERDYSALLYLNDDFQGGEFFFAHQNMSVQSTMKPQCGRVVTFNAGIYHGVKPVISGQRCALAIWFTLDKNFAEKSHVVAEKAVEDLLNRAFGPNDQLHVEL